MSTDQYRTLRLTEAGRDAMYGRTEDLQLRRPSQSLAARTALDYPADLEVDRGLARTLLRRPGWRHK